MDWLNIVSIVLSIVTIIVSIVTISICVKALRRGGDDK